MSKGKKLHRHLVQKDRISQSTPTLASTGPVRPVSGSSEDAGVVLQPDAGSLCDWMLVSIGPERPVSGSNEDASVGLRPDAGSLRDRMLTGCVRSR